MKILVPFLLTILCAPALAEEPGPQDRAREEFKQDTAISPSVAPQPQPNRGVVDTPTAPAAPSANIGQSDTKERDRW
jgi:hypothetical protein